MAQDLERLVVQLEASLSKFDRELRRAPGIADREARLVERRFSTMNQRLNAATAGLGRSLIPSLGAIGGALAIKEVANYADAWTSAKNSLAVAGVTGKAQAQTLDTLYESAQRNAAPIGALADLYGKAAQAGKELGATSETLAQFTDGVAVSLKVAGKSATESRGALTQLGQLLGSTRVMAEEFNSVNEGARPILMAVAAGMDAAGGSVSKLKQLVNAGEVSNKQFFESFLKGMPAVEAMAANATQTLAQGYTKVENALTKYIGQQDQSLGATKVLSNALNALANNFDHTADVVLKVVGIVAAALIGRALGGMVTKMAIASGEVLKLVAAIRTIGVASAISGAGISAAFGPIGAVLGVAAAATVYFATSTGKAGAATESAAQMADRYKEALKRVKAAPDDAGQAGTKTANKFVETEKNRLGEQAKTDAAQVDLATAAVEKYLSTIIEIAPRRLITPAQLKQLEDLKGTIGTDVDAAVKLQEAISRLANLDPKFQKLADQMKPLLDQLIAVREAARQTGEDIAGIGAKTIARRGSGSMADGAAGERERAGYGPGADKVTSDAEKEAAKGERDKAIDKQTEDLVKAYEKTGKTMTDALRERFRNDATGMVDAEIGEKATAGFTGDAIKDYVDRVVKAESGGRADAKNPNSSATGAGQFIESTWLAMFKKYYPEQAATMGRAAILELRKNGEISKNLIEAYAKENATALQGAGKAVTEANLHLAHFLGAEGAVKALNANPNDSARAVLGNKAANANPTIIGNGHSIQDVLNYADRRANATRIRAGDTTPEEKKGIEDADLRKKQALEGGRSVADIEAETAAILAQTGAVEIFNGAAIRTKEIRERMRELEDAKVEATPEDIKRIEAEADAVVAAEQKKFDAKKKVDDLKTNMAGVKDAELFFAEGATSAFTDVITGASSAQDAIKKLTSSLIDAALQAMLLGKGPLAGLFGTAAGADGGAGGLFGSVFKAFGFKDGGVMSSSGPRALKRYASGGVSNQAAVFGEAGPEAAVPLPDGRRIPVDLGQIRMPNIPKVTAPQRVSPQLRMSIDLTGANGDETIERISRQAAAQAAQQAYREAVATSDRGFPARQQRERRLGY